jgi:hypothetical protein
MAKSIKIGSRVRIPAGTKVTQQGYTFNRTQESVVTVRGVIQTESGNMKVVWKSGGYETSAVIRL